MDEVQLTLVQKVMGLPWIEIGQGLLMILGGASVIAKMTKTKADDKIINAILKFIHTLGLTKKDPK